jgi:hypothetical protein
MRTRAPAALVERPLVGGVRSLLHKLEAANLLFVGDQRAQALGLNALAGRHPSHS